MSKKLLRIATALIRMQHVFPPQHRLHGKQRQNQQGPSTQLRVGDRQDREHSDRDVCDQSRDQTILSEQSIHNQLLFRPSGALLHSAHHPRLAPWAVFLRRFAAKAMRASQLTPRPPVLSREGNHWCTGEDSNLRTSLGGTDLQSVGFNHSPTCAETFRARRPDPQRLKPPDKAS